MTKKTPQAGTTELTETDLDRVPTSGGLDIKLKNVIITSYQTGGSSSDTVPVERLSLNFEKIR